MLEVQSVPDSKVVVDQALMLVWQGLAYPFKRSFHRIELAKVRLQDLECGNLPLNVVDIVFVFSEWYNFITEVNRLFYVEHWVQAEQIFTRAVQNILSAHIRVELLLCILCNFHALLETLLDCLPLASLAINLRLANVQVHVMLGIRTHHLIDFALAVMQTADGVVPLFLSRELHSFQVIGHSLKDFELFFLALVASLWSTRGCKVPALNVSKWTLEVGSSSRGWTLKRYLNFWRNHCQFMTLYYYFDIIKR